jgi:hypothetical protein
MFVFSKLKILVLSYAFHVSDLSYSKWVGDLERRAGRGGGITLDGII